MRFSVVGLALVCAVAPVCLLDVSSAGSAPSPETAGVVRDQRVTSDATASRGLPPATAPHHFIVNAKARLAVKRLGFDVIDTGPSKAAIDALPSGTQAMVWLGEKCPTHIDDAFRASVRALKDDPKVYGYFLSDEPHIAYCPRGPARLATRTSFIRKVTDGAQKSFIVISATEEKLSYHAFRPAATGVDLVGIDPYPCSITYPRCSFRKITFRVRQAVRAGIPRKKIVPSFQAFGQERIASHYYNLPTRSQLRHILERWAKAVPRARLDFTYGWGNQPTAKPTLADSSTLQDLLRRYFRR